MSLDFKLRYGQLRENDPTKPDDASTTPQQDAFYAASSHTRNLCFMWPDGRRYFVSYAYLIGGELAVSGETNVITLNFSAYTVTLKGYRLEYLFQALLDHLPRFIAAVEPRYASSVSESQSAVIDMAICKTER